MKYLVKLYSEDELQNKYKEVILILLLQIMQAFIDSYIIGNAKILMESKYLSPYLICSTFGLINGLIIIIPYFIVSYFPCNHNLCDLVYNNKILTIYIVFLMI